MHYTPAIYQNAFFALIFSFLIPHTGIAQFKSLANPTQGNSFTPNLHHSPKGEIWMSWQQKLASGKHLLWMSKFSKNRWNTPIQVAQEGTSKWFVNWADFPTLTTFGKNALAANFLQKSAASTYAYDVKLKISRNGGKTWQPAFTAHKDGTPTEHGFVSLVPASGNRFLAVWLDGRETAKNGHDAVKHGEHHHGTSQKAMTLRAAFFDAQGKSSQPTLLDARVCDCCQTSVAPTNDGFVVVYRNRSPQEMRDIGYITYHNGQWGKPQVLHEDRWKINGCPVNGPSISAQGQQVAVAWYTNARNQPRVKVAFSKDGGQSFGVPTPVDEGNPLGRVAIATLPDGGALVVWLETKGEKTLLQLRKVSSNGQLGKIKTISQTSQSRASGFPQIVIQGSQAIIAWTQVEKLATKGKKRNSKKQIKTVMMPLK
ncbi:MAG TPA: hypothetical protein DCS93_05420 [Microscillaceae bacterium]|nr:hypothetical protein [Microscillaceae bacterium]